MHGTPVIDIQYATRFKAHIEEAIKELSLAFRVAHEVYTLEESAAIRKSIGDIIAATDTILYETVYTHHRALNELRRRQNGDSDS
jgi:hypothetical protein